MAFSETTCFGSPATAAAAQPVTQLPPLNSDRSATPRSEPARGPSRGGFSSRSSSVRANTAPNAAWSHRTEPSARRKCGGQKSRPPLASTCRSLRSGSETLDPPGSTAVQAVQAWWLPVETSVRLRRPQLLEEAIHDVHGSLYLQTIHVVRRSTSLTAAERHSLEMEMAARLVRARATLGKWQAGVQQIKAAQAARDKAALEAVLSKYNFAPDDALVAPAHFDLENWENPPEQLPDVQKEAPEHRDMVKSSWSRETRSVKARLVKTEAPSESVQHIPSDRVLPSSDAHAFRTWQERKTVSATEHKERNSVFTMKEERKEQRKTVCLNELQDHRKIAGSDGNDVKAPRKSVCLRGDDVKERKTIYELKEEHKALLRVAMVNEDMQTVAEVLAAGIVKSEDVETANEMLRRHTQLCTNLRRATRPPVNPFALHAAIQAWDFAAADPALEQAEAFFKNYCELVAAAKERNDGWALMTLCGSSGKLLTKFNRQHGLKEQEAIFPLEVFDCLYRFNVWSCRLHVCLRSAERLSEESEKARGGEKEEREEREEAPDFLEPANAAQELELLLVDWPFSHRDPLVLLAERWLRARAMTRRSQIRALRAVLESGSVDLVQKELRKASALFTASEIASPSMTGVEEQEEARTAIQTSQQACSASDNALKVVTALALGVDARQLVYVPSLGDQLATFGDQVRKAAAQLEPGRFPALQSVKDPPITVHKVLELTMHTLAGLRSDVKEPPANTDWSSCLHLLDKPQQLIADLSKMPVWMSSGNLSGVSRARMAYHHYFAQFDIAFSPGALRERSALAAQLLACLLDIFAFAECLEVTESGRTRTESGAVFEEEPHESQEVCQSEPNAASSVIVLLAGVESFLAGSRLLASSYVVFGGSVATLEVRLERLRRNAVQARAASLAADALFKALVRPASLSYRGGNDAKEVVVRPPPASSTRRVSRRESQDAHHVHISVHSTDDGHVLAQASLPITATPSEIRRRVEELCGIPARHQRLIFKGSILIDHQSLGQQGIRGSQTINVTLIRLSQALPHRLETVAAAVAACPLEGFDLAGPHRAHYVSDAAAYLVYGVPKGGSGTILAVPPPRPGGAAALQAAMLEVLHGALEALQNSFEGTATPPLTRGSEESRRRSWEVYFACEPMPLSRQLLARSSIVPLANLSVAQRALDDLPRHAKDAGPELAAATVAATVRDFVDVVESFYAEFVPQRAAMAAAVVAAEEAQAALRLGEAAVSLARQMRSLTEIPDCLTAEDVGSAAAFAAEQLTILGTQGLVLAAPHVEYARRAVDRAGRVMLANPPANLTIARLRWAETAMAIQLAAVRPFLDTLRSIAAAIDTVEVSHHLKHGKGGPAETVVSAAFRALSPDCRCDADWGQCLRLLQPPEQEGSFSQLLVNWQPASTDSERERLDRAKAMLCKVWDWGAKGCGGSKALGQLFAFVALAVELQPLTNIQKHLAPVHEVVLTNLHKVEIAEPHQQQMAAAKAWAATLFLLDTPGEAWWWLGLIRSGTTRIRPPWMDREDGGVGVSQEVAQGSADAEALMLRTKAKAL